jgi:hypothetical protein
MDILQAMAVFKRVVDASSFSKAADSLEIPRASVSTLVQNLESHLGVRLLNRTTRSVQVTDDGALHYEYCARILAEVSDAESALSNKRQNPRGTIRVDTSATFAANVLVPVMRDFNARYPDNTVKLGLADRNVGRACACAYLASGSTNSRRTIRTSPARNGSRQTLRSSASYVYAPIPHALRLLDQAITRQFRQQRFCADKPVSLQAGVECARHVGIRIVDEKRFGCGNTQLLHAAKIGLSGRFRCTERGGRIDMRAEHLRDGWIQKADMLGEQTAVVGEHRDPVMFGDSFGEREHVLVRRNRCVARAQPVIPAHGIVQQFAERAKIIVVVDLPRVGTGFKPRSPDRVAHGFRLLAGNCRQTIDPR